MKTEFFPIILVFLCLTGFVQSEFSLNQTCETQLNADEISVLELFDTNADKAPDIVTGTNRHGVLRDYSYYNTTCIYEWPNRNSFKVGGSIQQLFFSNLDEDLETEILINGALSEGRSPDMPGNQVTVISAKHFIEESWGEPGCSMSSSVSAGDLNDDGNPNIVAGGVNKVCAWEDLTVKSPEQLWSHKTPLNVFYVKVLDFEEDGSPEVLVVSYSKTENKILLEVLDSNGKLTWSQELSTILYPVGGKEAIQITDLDNDDSKDILVASYKGVHAYSITKGLLWRFNPAQLKDGRSISTVLEESLYGSSSL